MTKSKWTPANIADLTDRTAIVTGANTGLGLETAAELAGHGARVVLAVRNMEKGRAAADTIVARHAGARVSLQELDLSALSSVRDAAAALLDEHDRIDLLINNAGVMYTDKSTTAEGYELQFGTNHIGHFALTGLLLDRILATAGSRIVTVSSVGHKIRSAIDVDTVADTDQYDRVAAYGRSKLANLLFTYELQRRLATHGASTAALAAHPGGSDTELVRNAPMFIKIGGALLRPLMQSAAMGAQPTLRAATDPTAIGGQYYGPDGIGEVRGHPVLVESSKRSHDRTLQQRLWETSTELTAVTYPI
jgi:NAD(P)-dependent dehydrogenase (short-subunit alcohol dehydrogenase family)